MSTVVASPASAAVGTVEVLNRDGGILMYVSKEHSRTAVTGTGTTRTDFDGDGVDDTAGFGQFNVTGDRPRLPYPDAGVVAVTYSSTPRDDYLIGGFPDGSNGGCACFGESLTGGDVNADGYDDLIVGSFGEAVPANVPAAGAVWIIPGSADGLRPDLAQRITQNTPGVPGGAEQYDWFGAAVATGDLNADGYADLAIGAPGEAVGGETFAGMVSVLFGGPGGITGAGSLSITQATPGVPGGAEANDYFGATVAIGRVTGDRYADLVIAAPGENANGNKVIIGGGSSDGNGMLTLVKGAAGGLSFTGVTSVTGAAAAKQALKDKKLILGTFLWRMGMSLAVADVTGDGRGEIIAGVPMAETDWNIYGGAVVTFPGRDAGLSTTGVRVITQQTAGVPGAAEGDDKFGNSLDVGDVTGDGRIDVVVGAPYEDIGSKADAGSITVLRGASGGLSGSGSFAFDQNSSGVPGSAEKGDQFGTAVAVLSLDGKGARDLVVSAPGEEVSADTPGYASGSVTTFLAGSGSLRPTTTWNGTTLGMPGIIGNLMSYGSALAPMNGLYQ